MNNVDPAQHLSPDVRAAISTFLNESLRDAQPFAISDALKAVRRVFPDLEILLTLILQMPSPAKP